MPPQIMRLGPYRMEFDADRCTIHMEARFRHAVGLIFCILAQVAGMLVLFLQPIKRLDVGFDHLDWWISGFLITAGAVGLAMLPFSIRREKTGITIDRAAKLVYLYGKESALNLPGARAQVLTTHADGPVHSVMLVLNSKRVSLMNNIDLGEAQRATEAINQFLTP